MTNRRLFSRIYQGVFYAAILKKSSKQTNNKKNSRKNTHRKHGQGTEMLLPAKDMTNNLYSRDSHLSCPLHKRPPKKLMEKGLFSGRSDINHSLYHYIWRWKKGKYNSALWWQSLGGEPLHFTYLKSTFLQSHFCTVWPETTACTSPLVPATLPGGGRQGVHSHHLHSSWSDRGGRVLLAGRGVGGALGLWDGVAAAGLAVGGRVPLGGRVGRSGRELPVAEGVADEHPLVGQVGHLAVHQALLSRVLLQRVLQVSGFLVLV